MYETSTEALFFGRQDAMQRAALLPLSKWIRAGGLDPASIRLAEVGCGTGRFHTFIKVRQGCGIVKRGLQGAWHAATAATELRHPSLSVCCI